MKNRLRRREREAIRSKYAGSELLYKAMGKGARELEKRMGSFRFSAEELFMEVMAMVDDVKEEPRCASEALDDWWNTLYCDFRDLDTADSPEVVYVTLLLLGMCRGRHYEMLPAILMAQLTQYHPHIFNELQQLFLPELWRIGEERVHTRINAYMDSEEWISDEAAALLENLPAENVPADTKADGTKGATTGLTNRQLVILFAHLRDGRLQREVANIKALSILLSGVSGRSAGSIRQVIMKGVDYEKEAVHDDIDRIEALVRPISATLADQLKNSKEEN